MKIVIISDIHDNLENLNKCLSWCNVEKIDCIVCCGDVANIETLKKLSDGFNGPIYLVRGNMEIFEDSEVEKYKNIKYFGRIGSLEIKNTKIGICHEPFLINKVLETGDKEVIFYGHTHKPWIDKQKMDNGKEVKTVNPGTLGGVFQKATFAFWDNDNKKLELKILEQL